MSTDPIADLVEHPPRHDPPAPLALAEAVLTRVRREPVPRRTVWWPLAAAAAAILCLLPADGAGVAFDPEVLGLAIECLVGAGGLLALALLAGRGRWEPAWKA